MPMEKSRRIKRAWTGMILLLTLVLGGTIIPMPAASQAVTVEHAPTATFHDGTSPVVSQPGPAELMNSNRLMLPTVNRNACSGLRDEDMTIGTQMYGNTGRSSKYFPALRESDAHWLRVSIYWRNVEPVKVTPRQYVWGSADAAVAAARDACVNIIAVIEGTPDWAAMVPGTEAVGPTHLDDFTKFVAAVVARYDGSGNNRIAVRHWEFYNEPDRRGGWGGYPGSPFDGATYAAMLKAVYPVVKTANPAAQVVMGGIAFEGFTTQGGIFVEGFMEKVLAAGGGNYFDIMNYHCYPFNDSCRQRALAVGSKSSGLIEKAAAVKAMLDKHGLVKPVMLTEVGWHDSQDGANTNPARPPSNPEMQARKMVQLLTQSIAVGSKATIWWMLHDPRPAYPYDTGLVTQDSPPASKPALAVYRDFIARVGRAEFRETVSPASSANDIEAYRFRERTTNRRFYVVWLNPVSDLTNTTTKPFQVPGTRAVVYDKTGALVTVKLDADDGVVDNRVTVQVGNSPIYVYVD